MYDERTWLWGRSEEEEKKSLSSYLQSVPLLVGQPVVGKKGGGRVLQTNNLLNKVIIPNPKLLRHYIPQDPHPPTATQLNNGHSVQGGLLASVQCHHQRP